MDIKKLAESSAAALPEIEGIIVRTPLMECLPLPSIQRNGSRLFFKCETMQHTGSFKLRGAAHKLAKFSTSEAIRKQGVVAASTGNHGMAVCYAAKRKGTSATIYCPTTASAMKLQGIENLGGRLIQHGSDCVEAEVKARAAAQEQGRLFISPYNDADVIAGQGTCAVEMLQQLKELGVYDVDSVYVAVGGGGLIGGIGAYLKTFSPRTKVRGVWAINSPVMHECMRANKIIDVAEKETLSDGTAGGIEEGSITLDVCKKVIDECVLVSEEEIRFAMRLMAETQMMIVEGAAAVAVAGWLQRNNSSSNNNNSSSSSKKKTGASKPAETAVVVLCGRNITLSKFLDAIK